MKKFTTLALAAAMTAALGCTAFAADSVDIPVTDGSFVLTVNTEGVFTTDEDEYVRGWFQTYGAAVTIDKVTMIYNGEEVDVTSFAVLDGSDGNYTTYITPEYNDDDTIKVDGYFTDNSTLDAITAIKYYVTEAATAEDWYGGAVGFNDGNKGWTSMGQWTSAEEDRGTKEMILVAAAEAPVDEPADDAGDVAPVAYLAAVVALAGVAMVASKKVRA